MNGFFFCFLQHFFFIEDEEKGHFFFIEDEEKGEEALI